MVFVPVVDKNNKPLMPTIPSRTRRWIQSGKATPYWKQGIFCVRLNVNPSNIKTQPTAVGIDPGSKREAYTIKSESHTYLNILTDTPHWIKDALEQRRNMRRTRRFRKTRCREARFNNRRGSKLPPSTKARWQFKLNIVNRLMKIFPITDIVVEDVKAKTRKGAKKWNTSFGPLEVGKQWFYSKIRQISQLHCKQGYETKELREASCLIKNHSKLADKFECHNVDSWVLSNWRVGGHIVPDNTTIIRLIPIRLHRRQLHVLQFSDGGFRRQYGGTRSLGLKRGSLAKHVKYGLVYVGGTSKGRISVHSLDSGRRLSQNVKTDEVKFRTYVNYRRIANFSPC